MYIATTFGFSFRHGPHQDAQKSTIVTFPKLSLREITFPSGLGAEKSVLHLASPTAGAVAPAAGAFIWSSLVFIALPGLVFFNDSSKLL